MSDRAYDEFWANERSGEPDEWRGPQHEALIPDPEFVMLCADAERRCLTVGLGVFRGKPAGTKDCAFRLLERIELGLPGETPVLIVMLGAGESLRSAAARARGELERR